jgi:glutamate carboxypeptidase
MTTLETLQYFKTREPAIVEAIREIVDIESPSNNIEQSLAVVGHIVKCAADCGIELTVERVPADGVGEHLIIRAWPGESRHILLLGHTDTVHPIGSNKKNPTRIEGDRLYGCGIFDMKANIILMIEAISYLADQGVSPPCPVTILLSCDEETGSHTGRDLVEREAANAEICLVFEPSAEGRVKTGRKGTGQYTLVSHGSPAHAGLEPEKGVNAVSEIARQIECIHAVARPELGTTVNVCTISGGTTSNVIPEYAECEIDVRFTTMTEALRVDKSLRSLKPFDARVKLELLGAINRPPLERTPQVAALFEKARSIAASYDYAIDEIQVGGASDGNFVAALGVPVIDGLGLAGAGAHMLTEHILISDIADRATLLTHLIATAAR